MPPCPPRGLVHQGKKTCCPKDRVIPARGPLPPNRSELAGGERAGVRSLTSQNSDTAGPHRSVPDPSRIRSGVEDGAQWRSEAGGAGIVPRAANTTEEIAVPYDRVGTGKTEPTHAPRSGSCPSNLLKRSTPRAGWLAGQVITANSPRVPPATDISQPGPTARNPVPLRRARSPRAIVKSVNAQGPLNPQLREGAAGRATRRRPRRHPRKGGHRAVPPEVPPARRAGSSGVRPHARVLSVRKWLDSCSRGKDCRDPAQGVVMGGQGWEEFSNPCRRCHFRGAAQPFGPLSGRAPAQRGCSPSFGYAKASWKRHKGPSVVHTAPVSYYVERVRRAQRIAIGPVLA